MVGFIVLMVSAANKAVAQFSDRIPYEIHIETRQDLGRLINLNLDIAGVRDRVVTAYLSPDEYQSVTDRGYACTPVTVHSRRSESKALVTGLDYPGYATLTDRLTDIALSHPDICHLESAGQSVQGRELWWVRISDQATVKEAEPSVSLMATLHGDEPVATVLCMALIEDLTENYGLDARITDLVDNTDIRIMPLINPDGYEEQSRYNAHGVDLNRNYPDARAAVGDMFNAITGREPETQALMTLELDDSPTLAANFHAGSLVVNYPFDYTSDLSPDDALFRTISLAYASHNVDMTASALFENGIVRGSEWYMIYGGFQDWAYLGTGENHVTIEISTEKCPDPDHLESYWNANRESLLTFMETVHTGVGGRILDKDSGEPVKAWIQVSGNDHLVYSNSQTGFFQRMLLPGNYTLTVGAPGYLTSAPYSITVVASTTTSINPVLEKETEPDDNDELPSNWPDKQPVSDPTSSHGSGGCFMDILVQQ